MLPLFHVHSRMYITHPHGSQTVTVRSYMLMNLEESAVSDSLTFHSVHLSLHMYVQCMTAVLSGDLFPHLDMDGSHCIVIFQPWRLDIQTCFLLFDPQLLLFLKAFSEAEQTKLAMLSGILLGNGTLPATILTSLFTDSLVKEGNCAWGLVPCEGERKGTLDR